MPKTYYECPRCGHRTLIEVGSFKGLPDSDKHHFNCMYKGCYFKARLDDDDALRAIIHGFTDNRQGT